MQVTFAIPNGGFYNEIKRDQAKLSSSYNPIIQSKSLWKFPIPMQLGQRAI